MIHVLPEKRGEKTLAVNENNLKHDVALTLGIVTFNNIVSKKSKLFISAMSSLQFCAAL